MPGTGHSESPLVRGIGAIVMLIAVAGSLIFGWSWGSSDLVPTTIGAVVAVSAVGLTLYRYVYSGE